MTTDPVQCNVRAEWYWVKPGIEEVLKEHPQLTFRSEDVYHACLAKEAILWKAAEGFVVSTIEVDEFTDQRTFLIWIAWSRERGQNCAAKYIPFFEVIAKKAGLHKIETRTAIEALEENFEKSGWKKDTVVYTREL